MGVEECNICGKRFYDNGQKLKPRYARTAHEKTCGLTLYKKQKKSIKEWLDHIATKAEINRVYNFINEPKQNIKSSPPRRQTPSPVPNDTESDDEIVMEINDREDNDRDICSSASSGEWTSWRYNGSWYSYDSRNDVFDENGNYVGIRIQDEFNDEWRLDYD